MDSIIESLCWSFHNPHASRSSTRRAVPYQLLRSYSTAQQKILVKHYAPGELSQAGHSSLSPSNGHTPYTLDSRLLRSPCFGHFLVLIVRIDFVS